MRSSHPISPEVRFWKFVDKNGPIYIPFGTNCWIWTGFTHKGYGRITIPPHSNIRTHRFSWELFNGPIPKGLEVCHHCDNPSCIRPEHLFLATHKENMQDCLRKQRVSSFTHPEKISRGENHWSKTHPEKVKKGEEVHSAKLTKNQVIEIRTLYSTGEYSQQQLANMFHVTRTPVEFIVQGKTWKSLL